MLKDKKSIKTDILEKLRSLGGDGEEVILPSDWVNEEYFHTLDHRGKVLFEMAINELIDKGLLEFTPGHQPAIRLTEKGEDLIY